jgi:succinyl-diaminopimelate desuccinylase
MTVYRRGRATLADTEAQLHTANQEAADLRAQLDALRAQQEVAEAFEAQVSEMAALLARLGEQLQEIERTHDWAMKREVVEVLVDGIRVERIGDESGRGPRRTGDQRLQIRPAEGTGICYTDVSVLPPATKVPTVIFGPGDERLCHQPDERVDVEQVLVAARCYAGLVSRLIG